MTAPEIIYLQLYDSEGEEMTEYYGGDITWCVDQINDTDVGYIRIDLLEERLPLAIAEALGFGNKEIK